LIPLLKNFV
jgi:iron complex outermembrane receptor protein